MDESKEATRLSASGLWTAYEGARYLLSDWRGRRTTSAKNVSCARRISM